MKVQRAGQFGGKARRITVKIPMTEAQRAMIEEGGAELGPEDRVLELEVALATAAMVDAAEQMYPTPVPPIVERKPPLTAEGVQPTGTIKAHDYESPEYMTAFVAAKRKQRIVIAAMALGRQYFGTDALDQQIATMLGPVEGGGLTAEQIDAVTFEAMRPLLPAKAAEIETSIRPTESTAAQEAPSIG